MKKRFLVFVLLVATCFAGIAQSKLPFIGKKRIMDIAYNQNYEIEIKPSGICVIKGEDRSGITILYKGNFLPIIKTRIHDFKIEKNQISFVGKNGSPIKECIKSGDDGIPEDCGCVFSTKTGFIK
jgi:hypothetical protein